MMGDKPIVLLAYGAVGIGLATALPVLSRARLFGSGATNVAPSALPAKESIGVLVGLALLAWLTWHKLHDTIPWRYQAYAALTSILVAFLGPRDGRIGRCIATWLGLLVCSVIPWWLRDDAARLNISGHSIFTTLCVTALTYALLSRSSDEKRPLFQQSMRIGLYGLFTLIAIWLVMTTGLAQTTANTTPWHHWGAYLGPAQLVAANAIPLHDIPVQYGLGPTLLLAQSCNINCWMGLYWIAGLSTLMMMGLLAWMALRLNCSSHPLSALAVLSIVLVTCLLWTAYPPELMASMATPSTTGIRFLPGVIMLAWLVRRIFVEQHARRTLLCGHIIWLACIAWSPESALHASAVWMPYFVWTLTFEGAPQSTHAVSRFAWAVIKLLTTLALGLGMLIVVFRLTLGAWPRPIEYITYMLYPPGPLPTYARGTIWFAMACLACWMIGWVGASRHNENRKAAQASWLVALYCVATFTYYLGRSHDNNILNLLPYLSLLLIATKGLTRSGSVNTLAMILLATLIGWLPAFGQVHYRDTAALGRLSVFAPRALTDSFNRETADGLFYMAPQAKDAKLHPEDAAPALRYIRQNFHEPVEIFDLFMLVDGAERQAPWSALHGPENFVYIPSEQRREYLRRVAQRLQRPGWVLYEKTTDMSSYLPEYDSVYRRTQELDFGTYRAIRFTPR